MNINYSFVCSQQSVGRDITKMFNEDLFKLDTSVVPAAIRYDHVNPKEDNMQYNMFFLCKYCKLKMNNTPQHNDNVVRCCVVLFCIMLLWYCVVLCCVVVLFCVALCCVSCCVVLCFRLIDKLSWLC